MTSLEPPVNPTIRNSSLAPRNPVHQPASGESPAIPAGTPQTAAKRKHLPPIQTQTHETHTIRSAPLPLPTRPVPGRSGADPFSENNSNREDSMSTNHDDFYKKLRRDICQWLESKGTAFKYADILLLAPAARPPQTCLSR